MPIEMTTTTKVTCDNPACPGNSLPTDTTNGWVYVSGAITTPEETRQADYVLCSFGCLSAVSQQAAKKTPAGPMAVLVEEGVE